MCDSVCVTVCACDSVCVTVCACDSVCVTVCVTVCACDSVCVTVCVTVCDSVCVGGVSKVNWVWSSSAVSSLRTGCTAVKWRPQLCQVP